jgi:hypothetical protein
MHAPDEFLRHAAECDEMARVTGDPQSRATWRGMAERWRRCAEMAKRQSTVVRPRKERRSPTGVIFASPRFN